MEKEQKRDSGIGTSYLRTFFGSEPNGERREEETFKIAIQGKKNYEREHKNNEKKIPIKSREEKETNCGRIRRP